MAAVLLAHAKEVRDDGSIVEIVIWQLPEPLPPSTHLYKYSLFYGIPGSRRVGYDNERGKGTTVTPQRVRRSTCLQRLRSCSMTSDAMSRIGSNA